MSPAHLLCSVDVHALVEMLLQVGHHGVVSRHPVDTCVFQTCRLHHATAHLHNQRDKLRREKGWWRWRWLGKDVGMKQRIKGEDPTKEMVF